MPYYIVGRGERYARITAYMLNVLGGAEAETIADTANKHINKAVCDLGFIWAAKKSEIGIIAETPEEAIAKYKANIVNLRNIFFGEYETACNARR